MPRYLIISIVITTILALWSGCTEQPSADNIAENVNTRNLSSPVETPKLVMSNLFVDLFPNQGVSIENDNSYQDNLKGVFENDIGADDKKLVLPAFPFSLLGAWWNNGRRHLILGLNDHSLVICDSCQGNEYIRVNSIIDSDWKLLAVKQSNLSFLWLPEMLEVDFPLDEMEHEPRFE